MNGINYSGCKPFVPGKPGLFKKFDILNHSYTTKRHLTKLTFRMKLEGSEILIRVFTIFRLSSLSRDIC